MNMAVMTQARKRHAGEKRARKLGNVAIEVPYGKIRAIKGKYAQIRVIKPKYSHI